MIAAVKAEGLPVHAGPKDRRPRRACCQVGRVASDIASARSSRPPIAGSATPVTTRSAAPMASAPSAAAMSLILWPVMPPPPVSAGTD
jgi:hypothetical protein